jgi:hypothetical protein
VAVNIVDPDNVFRYAVRGRVINMTNERGHESIDDLGKVPGHPVSELHRKAGNPRANHRRRRLRDAACARLNSGFGGLCARSGA